jgi:Flp pilus assembly protein TadD
MTAFGQPPPPGPVAPAPPPASSPAVHASSHEAPSAPAETRPEPGSGSLVAQASRALRNGTLVKAVDLARQAVSANPSDAEAWLTLGAAYQATGDSASARQAYQSCVERARTADVGECRLLAGR